MTVLDLIIIAFYAVTHLCALLSEEQVTDLILTPIEVDRLYLYVLYVLIFPIYALIGLIKFFIQNNNNRRKLA